MLSINICIGSACHLKGSYKVIKALQQLIDENKLQDRVQLKGSFCLGQCTKAVSVTIENETQIYSLSEENTKEFFDSEIRRRL